MHTMTARILALAEAKCRGRLVLLLEGGYDAARTGAGAVMVLRALAGLGPEES
jgi:acetoin utilization deacetylase AcuC-like enzyme